MSTTSCARYDNLDVDYVVNYSFEDIVSSEAIGEFTTLINDLNEAGLETQVRHGDGLSLLVFIHAPKKILGNEVYKSRVKDWLYAITCDRPAGDKNTIVEGETEAEDLRSMFHLVTWQKHLGGAGITPGYGKWKNVKSAFPLHNQVANKELLKKWSKSTILHSDDLDQIRALFGEKVAFYFAFLQSYILFLIFPAVTGVICWLYLGYFSVTYALLNGLWCVVFVEYWKHQEIDLSLRWDVQGVVALKVNRKQWVWEKEVVDPITGEIRKQFSAKKHALRQLLQIPFGLIASVALGALIIFGFMVEVFIAEVYQGPFKGFLDFLPTIILSLSLPAITSALENFAERLTDYENHRTQDRYEMSLTQKIFMLNFVTSYLPIFLTAFVYVPFGEEIIPYLDVFNVTVRNVDASGLNGVHTPSQRDTHIDPSRLRQEVIYLTVTAQVLNFGEELVLPYVKQWFRRKYQVYRFRNAVLGRQEKRRLSLLDDNVRETAFLTRVRNEANGDPYNVQDDLLEMCVQFGYLSLFSSAWPLVPLGFLFNNWVELRSDFLKICIECQRPAPIRADSIGPWLDDLGFLTWLGSITTAALVYMFRGEGGDAAAGGYLGSEKPSNPLGSQGWAFLAAVFFAEHIYLVTRWIVRTILKKIGSESTRNEEAKRYAMRKQYFSEYSMKADAEDVSSMLRTAQAAKPKGPAGTRNRVYAGQNTLVPEIVVSAAVPAEYERNSERFWSRQATAQAVIDAGIALIKALGAKSETKKNVKGS